jgi:hypothetical protein
MVYLPMSYIYGKKATCPPTLLTSELKKELYPAECPFEQVGEAKSWY